MLPMANTAPRTDKQVFCYVSLMKLLTNRGTTHSKTSQTEHLLSAHQRLCHGQRAGEGQGQAQAAVQDRAGCASDRELLCWKLLKAGVPCLKRWEIRRGREGKVPVCLTLWEGDLFTNCCRHSFGTQSQPKTPAASNIHISFPTQCGQQHKNMTGAKTPHPGTHKQLQTYPRGARQVQGQPTAFCFAAILSNVQDGHQHPSLHCAPPALTNSASLWADSSSLIHTHCCALSLSSVQGFSRWWDNTGCRLPTSPIDHPWSWGLKIVWETRFLTASTSLLHGSEL